MNSHLPYRQNVCLLILDERNRVLIAERISEPGHWQLPQGGMREGADLEDDMHVREDALREASEELGVREESFRFVTILQSRHAYDFLEPPAYALDKFRGQTQRFVVLRLVIDPSQLQPQRADHPEFSALRWVTPPEIESSVAPRRREGYRAPIRELEGLLRRQIQR